MWATDGYTIVYAICYTARVYAVLFFPLIFIILNSSARHEIVCTLFIADQIC